MRIVKLIILIAFVALQLLCADDISAHGNDIPADVHVPDGIHTVTSILYGINSNRIHNVAHDLNTYKDSRTAHFRMGGYIGGHSGHDFDHVANPTAKFYSVTTGTVIKTKISKTNPEESLSYIVVYNKEDRRVISYVHPSYIAVEKGDNVYPGKYLGRQGCNKGFSTNPCNERTGVGYHLHVEVRMVLDADKPPKDTARGASMLFNDPTIEPIEYLYGELLEFYFTLPALGAPSKSKPRTLTQTWGSIKSSN